MLLSMNKSAYQNVSRFPQKKIPQKSRTVRIPPWKKKKRKFTFHKKSHTNEIHTRISICKQQLLLTVCVVPSSQFAWLRSALSFHKYPLGVETFEISLAAACTPLRERFQTFPPQVDTCGTTGRIEVTQIGNWVLHRRLIITVVYKWKSSCESRSCDFSCEKWIFFFFFFKGVFWQSDFFGGFFSEETAIHFGTRIYSYLGAFTVSFFNEINESCGNYVALGKACFSRLIRLADVIPVRLVIWNENNQNASWLV